MKTCVIESPYAGDVERNLAYLERAIRWCALNGFAPYASHKMMTSALDDNVKEERALGIECGFTFRRLVDERLFFVDLGYSGGMSAAKALYEAEGLSYREITIGAT